MDQKLINQLEVFLAANGYRMADFVKYERDVDFGFEKYDISFVRDIKLTSQNETHTPLRPNPPKSGSGVPKTKNGDNDSFKWLTPFLLLASMIMIGKEGKNNEEDR